MEEMDGIQVLQEINRQWPQTEVVIITAHGTIETAVKALKDGAYDYLTKPINVKRFRSYVHNILYAQELEEEKSSTQRKAARGARVQSDRWPQRKAFDYSGNDRSTSAHRCHHSHRG